MGDIDETGRTQATRDGPPDDEEPLARLKVRDIKRRLDGHETEADIARDFRIRPATVRRIRDGEVWADVPSPTGRPWPLDLGLWGEPGGESERAFPPRRRTSRDDPAPRRGDT